MPLSTRLIYGLMVFFCIGISGYAAIYWLPGMIGGPSNLVNNFGPYPLAAHAAGGSLALLLGPFQFLGGLRARRPLVHRTMGRLYVLGCLVGGVSGLILALGTTSGWVPGLGFGTLAIVWLTTTWLGVRAAMRRDFVRHRAWMVRTFALTLGAISLRFLLPGMLIGGVDPATAYDIVAWACWVPNLVLAEIWIAARRAPLVPAGVT